LVGYDFDIQYRLGKYNSVADTPYCASFASLSLAQGVEYFIRKMSCSGGGGGLGKSSRVYV